MKWPIYISFIVIFIGGLMPASLAVNIFSEGFEGVFPGSWIVGDSNVNAGADYWDDTNVRAFVGSWSGWAAHIGDNSVYGITNIAANSYDNYMDAFMYRPVSLGSYSSVTLSYKYWIVSESCCDKLYVLYQDSAGTWQFIDQHSGNSLGWLSSSVSIPTTAQNVGFHFLSDFSIVDQGAYIDEVVLDGTLPPPDSTAPSTSASATKQPSGTSYTFNTWSNENVQVSLSCSDTGSGCSTTRYCTDTANTCSPATTYSVPFTISSTGTTYVRYYSTDVAGNIETTQSQIVKVDKTKPYSDITTVPPTWVTSNLALSVTDTDSGSGVSTCRYNVCDNSPFCTWTQLGTARTCSSPFTVSVGSTGDCRTQGTNKCQIQVYAIDAVGNTGDITISGDNYITVSVDYIPPVVSINTPSAWKNAPFTFSYDATDAQSGTSTCEILTSTDGISFTSRYSGVIYCGAGKSVTINVGSVEWCNVQGVGKCQVKVKVTDTAGLVTEQTIPFSIDYLKPITKRTEGRNPGYSASCTFDPTISVPYDQSIPYLVSAYDEVSGLGPPATCNFFVDAVNQGTMSASVAGCIGYITKERSYTFPVGGSYSTVDTHTVYSTCNDVAGNLCQPGDFCHGGATTVKVCGRTLPSDIALDFLSNGCDLRLTSLARDIDVLNKPLKSLWTPSCCPITHTVEIDDAGENDCDFNDFKFKNTYGTPNAITLIDVWSQVIDKGCGFFGCGDYMNYGYKVETLSSPGLGLQCKFLTYSAIDTQGFPSVTGGNYPPTGLHTNIVSAIIPQDDGYEGHEFKVGECLGNNNEGTVHDCNFDPARPRCDKNQNSPTANICKSCQNACSDSDFIRDFDFYGESDTKTIACDVGVLSEYWYWFGASLFGTGKIVVDAYFTTGLGSLALDLSSGACGSPFMAKSCSSIANGIRCTFDVTSGNVYNLKMTKSFGSGNVKVDTKLIECTSNDLGSGAYSSFCNSKYGSSKAVCDMLFPGIGGKCEQCTSNFNFDGMNGDNDQCKRLGLTCPAPNENRTKTCDTGAKTCSTCGPCSVRTDCAVNYCCTAESSPGPGQTPGECKLLKTVINPNLCSNTP